MKRENGTDGTRKFRMLTSNFFKIQPINFVNLNVNFLGGEIAIFYENNTLYLYRELIKNDGINQIWH